MGSQADAIAKLASTLKVERGDAADLEDTLNSALTPGASVNVTGAKTLAATDSGIRQDVTAPATLTLPATVLGMVVTVRNVGGVAVTIAPNSVDKIAGNGYTATDNKSISSANDGDQITLLGDGANGWFVVAVDGTWPRAA